MFCLKFHQHRTVNEELDFLGVKRTVLEGLGVAKFGRTWEHVPKHYRMLFLPNKRLYDFSSRWRYILPQVRWTNGVVPTAYSFQNLYHWILLLINELICLDDTTILVSNPAICFSYFIMEGRLHQFINAFLFLILVSCKLVLRPLSLDKRKLPS